MKRLFTKKRLLSLALALLLIAVLLLAGFLLIPRPTLTWSYQAERSSSVYLPPQVVNGIVYLVSELSVYENTLSALDAQTGQVRWSFSIRGFMDDAPVVAEGLVYAVATDAHDQSTLHALDAASGREQWSYQQVLFSAPTIANGIVYLHSTNGMLYAFEAGSGAERWSVLVGPVASKVVVANRLVYLAAQQEATAGSTILALEATSGHTSWSVVETFSLSVGQLAVADGQVYLATSGWDAQVSALDALSGRTLWSVQPLPHPTLIRVAYPFQVVNGIAYLIYSNPTTLYAFDTCTGQVVWSAPTDSQMPTIANGLVYVYSGTVFWRGGGLWCIGPPCPSTDGSTLSADTGNGTLSALDARSGRQRWSHPAVPFKDLLTIAPEAAVEGGGVYVWTTKQGKDKLYALDAVAGSEHWSYQTGGNVSTSLTVVQGIVYTWLDRDSHMSVEAIRPPGGPPGFSR